MSTGPDHFRRAEQCVTEAGTAWREDTSLALAYLAEAQVHASLAVAAAMAELGDRRQAWRAAFDA